jgi:hypothetical protein
MTSLADSGAYPLCGDMRGHTQQIPRKKARSRAMQTAVEAMFCPADTTSFCVRRRRTPCRNGSSRSDSTDQPSAMIKGWCDRTRDFFRLDTQSTKNLSACRLSLRGSPLKRLLIQPTFSGSME